MSVPRVVVGSILSGNEIVLDEKRLPDIKVPKNLDAKLTAALRKGNLHGFRSGGGLRVFRIDKGNKNIAYGEHPNAMEALALLAKDCSFAGRAYEKVYGKLHPHYLTGSSEAQGDLDKWILRGNTLDAFIAQKGLPGGNDVRVTLGGYGEFHTPVDIENQIRNEPKGYVIHKDRGFVYKSAAVRGSRYQDDGGITTECVSCPPGKPQHRAWMWQTTQTGYGNTFFEALAEAFVANPVEQEGS